MGFSYLYCEYEYERKFIKKMSQQWVSFGLTTENHSPKLMNYKNVGFERGERERERERNL